MNNRMYFFLVIILVYFCSLTYAHSMNEYNESNIEQKTIIVNKQIIKEHTSEKKCIK